MREYSNSAKNSIHMLSKLKVGDQIKNNVTGEIGTYSGIKSFDEEADSIVTYHGIPAVYVWVIIGDHLTHWTLNRVDRIPTPKSWWNRIFSQITAMKGGALEYI